MLLDIPTPVRIAARPHDRRGFPVPAGVRWQDGVPQFAAACAERQILLMVEHRCAVCGHEMLPEGGPVWHTVDGPSIDEIHAQLAGHDVQVQATHYEAPGHRLCMLYSAVVCTYLANPTARRRVDAGGVPGNAAPLVARGTRRTDKSAVAGFARAIMRTRRKPFTVLMSDPVGIHPYTHGEELIDILREGVAADDDPDSLPVLPDYLGPDLAAVRDRLRWHGRRQRREALAARHDLAYYATAGQRIPPMLRGRAPTP